MVAHCLFEQSGVFKKEFRKLGIDAYDYDIADDYGQTDFKVDLFAEIHSAYSGGVSIFNKFSEKDLILAFFPCTRFEDQILLYFRGESFQFKNYTGLQKLEYAMKLHEELHANYKTVSELAAVCIKKNLKLVIENPYSAQHYLKNYWPIEPKIIDKNRRDNGDYMKKPTQYWFINFEPKNNLVFEPIEYVEKRVCDYITGKDRQRVRSEIHPQYANRFIRQYLIDA